MKKVHIKGVIVPNDVKEIYDWFGIEAVSPNDVAAQLEEANGEDLEVEINSGGGDVYAGSEIYTALKSYKGSTTGKIVGRAASAAGVVAMGVQKLLISPTAQFMMHNVRGDAMGDYRVMEHAAEFLKNYNVSIANAYMLKTGMTHDELLDLMNKETWLNAQQAVKYGFADEVMFDEGLHLVASAEVSSMLPPEVINKVRSYIKGGGIDPASVFNLQQPAAGDNISNQNSKKEGAEVTVEITNIDELRANFPDLVAQVENAAKEEGKKEGAQNERARIQAIDEIGNTVSAELVAKAKYEEPITAEALAFQALKADAVKGGEYLSQRQQEVKNSGADNVAGGAGDQKDTKALEDAAIENIAAGANQRRGR